MDVLKRIEKELVRVEAQAMQVMLDSAFEPDAGELVKVEYEKAYWHLLPSDFLSLLENLPDRAGPERVREAVESDAIQVWHGPSPRDSRDERL